MLIDKYQVAELMGVEPRTVNQWRHIAKTRTKTQAPPMPEPIGHARGRLWWDAGQVAEWGEATGRRVDQTLLYHMTVQAEQATAEQAS